MTLDDLYKICNELSEQFNDEFNIPIVINKRFTSTLGQCTAEYDQELGYYVPTKIEIAGRALQEASDACLREVIMHEWCHAYLIKTDHEIDHGHDETFKKLAKKIGIPPSATTKYEMKDGSSAFRAHKYTVICPKCGEIAGYNRMCRVLKNIWSAEHSICGTIGLTYEQNW